MKTKGKKAWLITWEGDEAEYNGRCKVVAILPPRRFGKRHIESMLRLLFRSECEYRLCEKLGFAVPIKNDPFFKEYYEGEHTDYYYGYPKEHLHARKVKDLRCEEKAFPVNTLFWTEYPRCVWNPTIGPNGPSPGNPADWLKQVVDEKEAAYTYPIRSSLEARQRLQKQIPTGMFSSKFRA